MGIIAAMSLFASTRSNFIICPVENVKIVAVNEGAPLNLPHQGVSNCLASSKLAVTVSSFAVHVSLPAIVDTGQNSPSMRRYFISPAFDSFETRLGA